MRTITVDDCYHWKALKLNGEQWRCVACDDTRATHRMKWQNHRDEVLFELRYCAICLPEILMRPPLEEQAKLPDRSEWALKLSSSEGPCDECGCPIDFYEGLTGQYVLCPAHKNRRGRLTPFGRRLKRVLGRGQRHRRFMNPIGPPHEILIHLSFAPTSRMF